MPERGVLYSVGRDTTERRRMEAELREAQRNGAGGADPDSHGLVGMPTG